MGKKEEAALKIIAALKRTYPDANCALNHANAFELLVATILSAQCTDARVNMVTPALFKRFPNAKSMASARIPELEGLIRSTGFYKNKAKSLVECSKSLVETHAGEVPRTMDELTSLRGVGRKTSNVILGNVFDIPGLVVDTHVGRLSRRMGLTKEIDPVKVEQQLMKLVPREDWTIYSHLLISHGRARCQARSPDCENCEILALCPRIGVAKILDMR